MIICKQTNIVTAKFPQSKELQHTHTQRSVLLLYYCIYLLLTPLVV